MDKFLILVTHVVICWFFFCILEWVEFKSNLRETQGELTYTIAVWVLRGIMMLISALGLYKIMFVQGVTK